MLVREYGNYRESDIVRFQKWLYQSNYFKVSSQLDWKLEWKERLLCKMYLKDGDDVLTVNIFKLESESVSLLTNMYMVQPMPSHFRASSWMAPYTHLILTSGINIFIWNQFLQCQILFLQRLSFKKCFLSEYIYIYSKINVVTNSSDIFKMRSIYTN